MSCSCSCKVTSGPRKGFLTESFLGTMWCQCWYAIKDARKHSHQHELLFASREADRWSHWSRHKCEFKETVSNTTPFTGSLRKIQTVRGSVMALDVGVTEGLRGLMGWVLPCLRCSLWVVYTNVLPPPLPRGHTKRWCTGAVRHRPPISS